ncbi:TetR/AcrR family transcriptional regulator [Schumannella soli]|uniref:TetR family transcriptional regulator n=1 Tax=Schumannella soli TaxID=2590779 RepID=A0A506Y2I0_9MICO|nr:TetR family transcriptional regulator C-terminal domain-containing protein [Schumannella soli]TPW75647.1 TetR family transcriptional regulator [Schumannella soli]
MPKKVDHDVRRHEIVDAFLRVTARDGYAAATSRAVAQELGVATGALWHYFSGFDAVIDAAMDAVVARTNRRITSTADGLRGLAAVDAIVTEMLPLTKETRDEAHVVVGFWGRLSARGAAAPDWAADDDWVAALRRHLGEAVQLGELRSDADPARLTTLLEAVFWGRQVVEVIASEPVDAADHRAAAETALQPWITRATTGDLPERARLSPRRG